MVQKVKYDDETQINEGPFLKRFVSLDPKNKFGLAEDIRSLSSKFGANGMSKRSLKIKKKNVWKEKLHALYSQRQAG